MNDPNTPNPVPVHDFARAAYFQSLFVHRRVLLVSDSPALVDFLIERRARYVCAVTENEAAAASWPGTDGGKDREIKIMPLSNLAFRDGMFDLALVADLTTVSEPAALFNEARRIVGPRGCVVVASPNPACATLVGPPAARAALDYYELYDLLSAAFDSVQMIGVSGFLGYQISDLGAEEADPAIAFDGTLLGEASEEIEWFLAVCGPEPVQTEALAVVQIPLSEGQFSGARTAEVEAELERVRTEIGELEGRLRETRLEMGTRGVRIETLENELERERLQAEEARARAVQITKQHDDERKAHQARRLDEEMGRRAAEAEIQGRLRDAELRLRQAEARAESAEASRDDLVARMREDAAELDRLREEGEELGGKLESAGRRERELAAELERLRREAERAATRERELAAEAGRRAEEVDELRRREAELAVAVAEQRAAGEGEIADLERRLSEIGTSCREAQAEVERREGIIRDLVVQIEDGATRLAAAREEADATEARWRDRDAAVDEKERLVARLEGELQASLWRASELEARARDAADAASTAERRGDLFEGERDRLREELAAAIDSASGHHRARVEAELQLATAQIERERFETELSEFIARTRELEERLCALQGAASGHHRARVEAELQLATAQVEHERLETELSEFIARTRELEERLFELQGAAAGHHRAGLEARLEIAEARSETDAARADLEAERTRARRLEADLVALREDLARTGAERDGLERRLAEAAAEARRLGGELDRAMGLAGELQGVDEQVRHLQGELDRHRTKVASLEAEAGERAVSLASTQRHARQMEQEAERLRELAGRTEAELGQARERVAALEAAVADSTEVRGRLERECGDLRSRLEEAVRIADGDASERERERGRAEEALRGLAAIRAELDGARRGLEDAARERDEARRWYESEIGDARRLVQRFADRLEQLERVREEAAGTEGRDLDRLEREREEAAALLERERGTIRGLEAALTLARAEADEERERTGLAGADAARLAGNLADLQEQLAERQREIELRSAEADAAERGLLALREDVTRLGEQLEEARASRRAESVRSRSLLEDVERLAGLEAELEEARERLADLERLPGIETALEDARATLAGSEAERRRLEAELVQARADAHAAQELVELRLTSARQAEELARLQEEARQRDPLLESLTAQLEEREQRAAAMERRTRQLEERCKEHESDTAAWETELKFRAARIAQLEEEFRQAGRGAAGPGSVPPPAGESPAVLRKQLADLGAELGDKDAELLLIHARAEEVRTKLERTRKSLQNLLAAGQVGSATAVQIHDIIISMERGGA